MTSPRAAVRLGVITDVHLTLDPTARERWHHELDLPGAERRLRAALEVLRERAVDLVVVCGDLTHFGDAASLDAVVAVLADAPAPVLVVPGNHDALVDPGALAAAVERAGLRDVRLVTAVGELVAPGIRLAGRANTPVEGRSAPDGTGDWADDLVVWLAHFPVATQSEACVRAGLADAGDAQDVTAATTALAGRRGPTIGITGHLHVRHVTVVGSLLQLGSAALVEAPGDVGVVELRHGAGTVVRWDWRSLAPERGLRLPVLAPMSGELVWDAAGAGWHEPAPLPAAAAAALRGDGLAAVAFDWNGTLVDDREHAWRATAIVLARRGRPDLDRDEFAAAFRLPLTALFDDLGAADPAAAADEWNELMGRTEPTLMPGALDVLRALRASGVALGVISAAAHDVVAGQVAACGLGELVDFVVAGPAPKRETLARLGRLAPGRVAYIGDTEYDVQEALAAGVRALGWAHGYRPVDALLAAGAERVLTAMAELCELPATNDRQTPHVSAVPAS